MTSKRAVKRPLKYESGRAGGQQALNDSFKRLSFQTSNRLPSRRPANAHPGCRHPSSNFIATEGSRARQSIRTTRNWNGFARGEDDQMTLRESEPRHHHYSITEPPPAPGLVRHPSLSPRATRLSMLSSHQRIVKVSLTYCCPSSIHAS